MTEPEIDYTAVFRALPGVAALLAGSLARHHAADPETLADALLADLLPPGGLTDDTALVVVRL